MGLGASCTGGMGARFPGVSCSPPTGDKLSGCGGGGGGGGQDISFYTGKTLILTKRQPLTEPQQMYRSS